MKIEIIVDSEELSQDDYREVSPGIFATDNGKKVVVLDQDDIGLQIELNK